MKRSANIIIILLMVYLTGCSPVRTNYARKYNNNSSDKQQVNTGNYNYRDDRFLDTTIIYLDPIEPTDVILATNAAIAGNSAKPAYAGLYEEALTDFDNKNYDAAAIKFRKVTGSASKTDPLYWESMFYLSETWTVRNNFPRGEDILLKLYDDPDIMPSIMEKVLVRLGQIQCVKKNEELADYYFSRLKVEFPDSKYVQLADCSFLKK